MSNVKRKTLAEAVHDEWIIKYFYLDLSVEQLIHKQHSIEFVSFGDDSDIPFTAKNRGYTGAEDTEGYSWLIMEVTDYEIYQTQLQEIAYYMDFLMDTLAAPTFLFKKDDCYYRTTKNIKRAMQIGSYNYLEKPFIKILANDLINRWLFFDEDRNPNNYLVLHNSKEEPFIVVIDYNKTDLSAKEMKIMGNKDKFGWHRKEKTRFLTLLKPENFENLSIEDFEGRLEKLMSIPEEKIRSICLEASSFNIVNPEETTELVVSNLLKRRAYINNYFRTWFKPKDLKKEREEDERYSGLGKSFLDIYKKKK